MQTVPPTLRLAVAAMVSVHRNGRFDTGQPHNRRPMHWLGAARHNGANIIRFGHQIAVVGFACQPSSSITAVRFSQRREMLHSRAKLVRLSRFAPAAKPPVSLPRAAPRRSVSHSSQHSGGCNQQASWPITVSASCQANTSSVQSGRVIACQRRECAA